MCGNRQRPSCSPPIERRTHPLTTDAILVKHAAERGDADCPPAREYEFSAVPSHRGRRRVDHALEQLDDVQGIELGWAPPLLHTRWEDVIVLLEEGQPPSLRALGYQEVLKDHLRGQALVLTLEDDEPTQLLAVHASTQAKASRVRAREQPRASRERKVPTRAARKGAHRERCATIRPPPTPPRESL